MPKVLIVDDESDARMFVRAILEGEGWEAEEAEDGAAGFEKIKSLKPDLVVLDVQMPKQDGFATFEQIIKDDETKDTKVVMLTGVGQKFGIGFSKETMGDYMGKEPDAYVEKPVDPEVLKRVVAKVMG
jgi:CheY-like chemotaxis protein